MQNLIDVSATAIMAAMVERLHSLAQYWRKQLPVSCESGGPVTRFYGHFSDIIVSPFVRFFGSSDPDQVLGSSFSNTAPSYVGSQALFRFIQGQLVYQMMVQSLLVLKSYCKTVPYRKTSRDLFLYFCPFLSCPRSQCVLAFLTYLLFLGFCALGVSIFRPFFHLSMR